MLRTRLRDNIFSRIMKPPSKRVMIRMYHIKISPVPESIFAIMRDRPVWLR